MVASTPSTNTPRVVHREHDLPGELGHRVLVGDGDAVTQRGERHCPVHRPGVEVVESEPPRDLPPDRALAGAGRTVDGDDDPGHRSSPTNWFRLG